MEDEGNRGPNILKPDKERRSSRTERVTEETEPSLCWFCFGAVSLLVDPAHLVSSEGDSDPVLLDQKPKKNQLFIYYCFNSFVLEIIFDNKQF